MKCFFFCVLHIFQNFPCTLGEKSKSVSFSRVYVCVNAKLTFVSFFFLFIFVHLSLSGNYILISDYYCCQCTSEPWSIADDDKVPLRTSEALWKGWVCQNELLVTVNAKFLTFHFDCQNQKKKKFFQITKCIC